MFRWRGDSLLIAGVVFHQPVAMFQAGSERAPEQKGEMTMFSKRTVFVVALTVALGGSLRATGRIVPPSVPAEIDKVPEGMKPFLKGHAIGTQYFICAPAATATGVDWLFLGPQATVFDESFEQDLTHFLSKNPYWNDALHATWQHSRDSSNVWARKWYGSTDPQYVAADAIEWLLLEVTSTAVGPTGGDKLAGTKFIHRVNTVGGIKPPAGECAPGTLNSRKLVYYEADYYFYQ
jgi:hypothetical protein